MRIRRSAGARIIHAEPYPLTTLHSSNTESLALARSWREGGWGWRGGGSKARKAVKHEIDSAIFLACVELFLALVGWDVTCTWGRQEKRRRRRAGERGWGVGDGVRVASSRGGRKWWDGGIRKVVDVAGGNVRGLRRAPSPLPQLSLLSALPLSLCSLSLYIYVYIIYSSPRVSV